MFDAGKTRDSFFFNTPLLQTNITSQMWPSRGKGRTEKSLICLATLIQFTSVTGGWTDKFGIAYTQRYKVSGHSDQLLQPATLNISFFRIVI